MVDAATPPETETPERRGSRVPVIVIVVSALLLVAGAVIAIGGRSSQHAAAQERARAVAALRAQRERTRRAVDNLATVRKQANALASAVGVPLATAQHLAELDAQSLPLEQQLQQLGAAGNGDAYNRTVDQANALIDQYNAALDQLSKQIDALPPGPSTATA
jgi:flagellar basal body-associated protein FliL